MKRFAFNILTISVILQPLATVSADIIAPDGLVAGDQYRIAFVTSGTRDATSSDINVYNDFVTSMAAAGSLTSLLPGSTTWSAIASTPTVNAIDNTGTSGGGGVPIFLVDGATIIANDYADLWDETIDSPISQDQDGALPLTQFVWTGTDDDGTGLYGLPVTRPLGGGGASALGRLDLTNAAWIRASVVSQDNLFRLYGLSSVQTVSSAAVPEPSSLILLALTGAWYFFHHHRKQELKATDHA